MKFPWIPLLCVFIFLSPNIHGQNKNLSLEDAKKYALQNNHELKNARLEVEKAKKKVWETSTIGLPQVSAEASYMNIFKVPKSSFVIPPNPMLPGGYSMQMDLGVKETTKFTLSLNQLLFSGSYIVGLQASRTYKEWSERSVIATELEVIQSVTQAYYAVLIVHEAQSVMDSILENLKKNAFEIEKMLEEGFVEDSDLDQMHIAINEIENAKKQLLMQGELGERALKLQMGMPADENIELGDDLDDIIEQIDVALLLEQNFVLDSNINYKLMNTQETLMNLNVKNMKADFLPSVSAFFSHMERAKVPDFDFEPPNMLGVSVNIPVFGSGYRISKLSQAKIELQKVKNSKEFIKDGLSLEYKEACDALELAYNKYLNAKKSRNLAKSIYNKTQIKYREGISSSFDLSQSESQYFQKQSEYFNAIMELLNAKTKLEKTLSKN
jgi:outer membrane protein